MQIIRAAMFTSQQLQIIVRFKYLISRVISKYIHCCQKHSIPFQQGLYLAQTKSSNFCMAKSCNCECTLQCFCKMQSIFLLSWCCYCLARKNSRKAGFGQNWSKYNMDLNNKRHIDCKTTFRGFVKVKYSQTTK